MTFSNPSGLCGSGGGSGGDSGEKNPCDEWKERKWLCDIASTNFGIAAIEEAKASNMAKRAVAKLIRETARYGCK
jgi:hypothetical protein